MSDYQQLLAELPCDWSTLPIEEIGEVISGGTPSRNNPSYWGGEILWVTPGEVTGFGRKHLEETDEKITTEGLAQSGAKLLPANSLLVTTRASLGAAVLNAVPATTNQGFKSIAFTNNFSPDYYYHWASKLKDELVRLASGTTFLEISGSQFRKISVPVPPRAEQELIAHLLDTFDTQIQKTEALIAKLEKIKEGLLHDLLTRGIDENGRLRPSPEQAPELYKESPLGLIPREWEAIPLTRLLEDGSPITYGVVKPGARDDQNGVFFIRGGDIKNGKIAFENLRTIHKTISMQYKRTLLAGGEILMSLVGYPGEVAIVPPELRGANIARQAALIRISKAYSSEFVATFLMSGAGKQQVLGSSLGSAQQVVNLGDLRNTMIPMPPTEEQRAISLANDEQQALQERAELELEKLKLKKQGLMDDLLTGRVRVTPLLDQAQDTTPA